ncbi:MAG: tRNA lysidine(34) synthetase TilS [Nitratireductor sp.]|nr:tRNA lysidine(34) synthetase TilS [Nitratireductor sp.]
MTLSPRDIFSGIDNRGIVIVAVSGGGDSIALLLLANAWAQENDATLHAVTVDHGLRPEAAAEAAFVASLCESLGVDHTTLGWEGIKPGSGLPEAARMARYALMEEFALEIGADMIMVAHTADDQAETVQMRLLRDGASWPEQEPAQASKSGRSSLGRGLAGMPRLSLLPEGTVLFRPLLDVTRSQLRSYLAEFPQSWIEDPTNRDTAYERVRIRQMLAGEPALAERLTRFSKVMEKARAVLSRDTAIALEACVTLRPGPVFVVDLDALNAMPAAIRSHAMQILVAAAGGGEHLASRDRIDAMVSRLIEGQAMRATLGGAVIERAGSGIRLFRELRNLKTIHLAPGETVLWDGRMEITNSGRKPVHVGPLSRKGLAGLEAGRGKPLAVRPRAALLTTAAVHLPGDGLILPMVEAEGEPDQILVRMTAVAIEHFCAQSDFPILDWLRALESRRQSCLLPRG